MKVRDAIRMIERDGWRLVNQEGSHRQIQASGEEGACDDCGLSFDGP